MNSQALHPPPRAERLLTAALPAGLVGNTIIGDLHQEFAEIAGRRGQWAARAWYWLHAIELSTRYAWRSLRGIETPYQRLLTPHSTVPRSEGREEIMATLLGDLRYGARLLFKNPTLSLVSIFTMALGTGLTIFTFSMVYGTVMRGVPVPNDDRLVSIQMDNPERDIRQTSTSYADLLDYREQSSAFEFLGAVNWATVNLATQEDPPARYQGATVTDDVLANLGIAPILGRVFVEGEDDVDAPPLMVLSHHVWQQRFDSDPDIVGRLVRSNGIQTEVIGVMPDGFRFPFDHDMWLNLRLDPDLRPRRSQFIEPVGRLRPDASMESVTAELRAITAQAETTEPDEPGGYRPTVQLFEHRYMPPEITAIMWVMLAAVFGVLLIACANVANLLLARAALRGREVAVRTALGASRFRVVRQLLSETAILAFAGGTLGLVTAKFSLDAWSGRVADIQKPYWIDFSMDGTSILFTIGIVVATALLSGTIPALKSTGRGMGAVLQDESRGGTSFRLGRLSSTLVIGEVAISCALLIAAGLMIKSILAVSTVELGYRSDGIVSGRVGLFESDYPEREDREQFFADLVDRLRAEPGFSNAALMSALPGIEAATWTMGIEGDTYESDTDYPRVTGTIIGTEFFSMFDVNVLRGREFNVSEMGASADPVAVINESFRRRHFGDRPAVGARIRLGRSNSTNPWMQVVGVVPDLHVTGGVGGIGSDSLPREQIYVSQGIFDVRFLTLAVQTNLPLEDSVKRMRDVVAALDPNLPVYEVRTVPQALDEHTWAFKMFGELFATLGFAALFLAAVGLYGVMAFSVTSRRREMGVRMALGAGGRDVLSLVLKKGAIQLGIGLTLGLAIGAVLARPMRFVTYGVEATDPTVYAAIVVTLVVTGLIATLVPARRAARVDPATALRND
ncbi:MAG: FtsX-like permease family protein [Acidobacteria bacterium]|nr:FtsX-like permease family protein [Acidobacteriota bacterium]